MTSKRSRRSPTKQDLTQINWDYENPKNHAQSVLHTHWEKAMVALDCFPLLEQATIIEELIRRLSAKLHTNQMLRASTPPDQR